MIRRFGAALTGLALCIPIFAVAPVAASGSGFVVTWSEQADGDVVGYVVNHQGTRQTNVQVQVTFENGTVDLVESGPVLISNLAPHNASPFRLDPSVTADPLPINSVTATGSSTGVKPTGGLHVDDCVFTGDVCEGTIVNDSSVAAQNVRVAGVRGTAPGTVSDAAESATIVTLAAGDSTTYAITFAAGSSGQAFKLIAKTNPVAIPGAFLTSWNNYFSDLSNATESFVPDIAFMADEGITLGCGAAIFCPRDNVSRAAMAVFLDRALGLTDAGDQGFTDIGSLSAEFQQAINNVAAAGITSGCSTTPLKYCPSNVVTRGQMSKFIVEGYNLTPLPCTTGSCTFTDDDGHFSEPYNEAMADAEITTGCGANKYCPNSAVLREQMAVFIHRAELLP